MEATLGILPSGCTSQTWTLGWGVRGFFWGGEDGEAVPDCDEVIGRGEVLVFVCAHAVASFGTGDAVAAVEFVVLWN